MERSFQLQEKKNSLTRPGGIKQSSDFKSPISVEKDSDNPFHSTILSMQKTYGNQYVQELVSGERTACPELCGLSEPLVASPTRPIAQFKPHSCDSCIFHPQRSVKRTAAGDSNPQSGIPFQAKLKIGQPGDVYEQEANRVAEQILRIPESQVQRQRGEKKEEEKVQREASFPQLIQLLPLTREGESPCQRIRRELIRVIRELQHAESDICRYQRSLREAQECVPQIERWERCRETGEAQECAVPTRCLTLGDVEGYSRGLDRSRVEQHRLQREEQQLREQYRRECGLEFPRRSPTPCR